MILTLALAAALATSPNTASVRCEKGLVYAWTGWVWASSGEKCVDLPAPDLTKWEQIAAAPHPVSNDVQVVWSVAPPENELVYRHVLDINLKVNILAAVSVALVLALATMWAWLSDKLKDIQDSLTEETPDE